MLAEKWSDQKGFCQSNSFLSELGQIGCVPASAEGFDEQDAGVHLAAHDVDVVALVDERGGLRGDDLKVGVDAADVAVVEDLLRDSARTAVAWRWCAASWLEDAESGEVVFDLLEGGERWSGGSWRRSRRRRRWPARRRRGGGLRRRGSATSVGPTAQRKLERLSRLVSAVDFVARRRR